MEEAQKIERDQDESEMWNRYQTQEAGPCFRTRMRSEATQCLVAIDRIRWKGCFRGGAA